jgi:16S rRNA processing protein RimM
LEKFFEIGIVVKPHGLRGRVKLNSFLVEPHKVLGKADEAILRCQGQEKGPLRILQWSVYKGVIFLELDGVNDVTAAESLVGYHVLVSSDALEELPEDEFYWHELIGMKMVTESGQVLGELTSIFSTGSNDVYVCTGERGEILIPAIRDCVLEIDKSRGRMVIRLLDGMEMPS